MPRTRTKDIEQPIRHYFVDESGDPTIFGRKHKIMLGTPGVSDVFMLGLLSVGDPVSLSGELEGLRQSMLKDPYFKGVPSIQPAAKKTAIAFHAKDDLPEVRKAVFELLMKRDDLRFFATIKNKRVVLEYVLNRNQSDPRYHYNGNELYDFCVRRLFRDRLHASNQIEIVFAKRLNSDRTEALKGQLELARANFFNKYNQKHETEISILTSTPGKAVCLQAVDYFLWALTRMYINREDRYINLLQPSIRLIMDIDDTRKNIKGEYYSQRNPIALAKIPELNTKPVI
jgi:hypothetical protein